MPGQDVAPRERDRVRLLPRDAHIGGETDRVERGLGKPPRPRHRHEEAALARRKVDPPGAAGFQLVPTLGIRSRAVLSHAEFVGAVAATLGLGGSGSVEPAQPYTTRASATKATDCRVIGA